MKAQLANNLFVICLSILVLSACKEEEEYKLNTLTVSVNTSDSVALSVTPSTGGWVFASANNVIATVSAKGVVTGKHTGTTTVSVNNTISGLSAQVPVTVTAKNTMYCEPYPYFYVDEKTITDFEKRTLVGSGRLTTGISYLLYEPDNLFYEGLIYLFSDSLNYYESEVILFNWYDNRMYAHLNDRYINAQYSQTDSPYYSILDNYMISPDSLTEICRFDGFTDRNVIIYRPYNCTESMLILGWSLYSSNLGKKKR